ncbi:hypothetical protein [Virgibacillus sp. DJP39]|uniref:hypothetical protein n=1 Tax=Virgibacillus sp. DJP39 TaxID=3409790 RepID=UPI003BB54906
MVSSDQHEENIKESLKNMPEIASNSDKAEMYHRISSRVNHPTKKKRKKRFVLIPTVSLSFILLIFVVIANLQGQSFGDYSRSENSYDKAVSQEDALQNEAKSSSESLLKRVEEPTNSNLVIEQIKDYERLVHGNVQAKKGELLIPFSYVIPVDQTDVFYNEQRRVIEKKLSGMFDSNHFKIDIPLGKSGEVMVDSTGYNIYQSPINTKEFLLPVSLGQNSNFKDALEKMKKTNDRPNVVPAIPDNVSFSLTQLEDNVIQLELTSNAEFIDNAQYKKMIQAILMSAKSFGYDAVKFTNTTINQIGPYQLNNPINVPLAVNPIDLQR